MDDSADVPASDSRPQFDVEVEMRDDAESRVTLRGELDIASAEPLRAALDAAIASTACMVRVDLAGLRFIDAAGIGQLIRAHAELSSAGRRMAVDHVHPGLQRTLRLAEADWLVA